MENILNRIVKYSIYVLVFLLPLFWLPFSFEAFEFSKQYLLFFLVSLAFFAWVLKQVVYEKEIRFQKSPLDYLVLGFLFISLLSVIFSVDKGSSILGFYGRFSNGLVGLFSLGALYFLITNNASVDEEEKSKTPNKKSKTAFQNSKLIKLFFLSSGLASLMGYFSIFGLWAKINGFLTLPPLMLQRTFNPVAGSLEGLAVFLAIAAVLLSAMLLSTIKNIFYWVLLAGFLGLLVLINFTPAWIVLSATLILFLAMSLSKRIFKDEVNKLLIPIFLVIISLVFIIWQPLKIELPKEQILSQSVSWQIAAKSAADNIKTGFLGSGLGTFHYDFASHKPQSINQSWMWQVRFDRSGSYLAELLATTGFLGLLIYLGLAALFLFISWFFISKDFAGLPIVMAFAALIVSQFVYYQNSSLAFIFWLVLGLSAVSWRMKSPDSMTEKKISFKNFPELSLLLTTLVIIFGAVILSLYFYGIKYYLADVNYANNNLEKAINQNPNLSNYRQTLAKVYLADVLREMQKPQKEQDLAKIQLLVSRSISQAQTAANSGPNQVVNWETMGIIYREIRGIIQGAADWGIKSFEKAIILEPANPIFYTELGKLYLESGNKEKARDNFNKALEKKSDYEPAVIQLALLLEQDDNSNEAAAKLESLIRDNPYNIEARFQLGRIYFNGGRADDAIEQFKAVTILTPNHSNAYYSLGVAYASQREIQLAVQAFEKVLELNPGNADVIQKLKNLR